MAKPLHMHGSQADPYGDKTEYLERHGHLSSAVSQRLATGNFEMTDGTPSRFSRMGAALSR